jgi:hypothetical protein
MAALVPCSACSRHIRASEASCPFCGGTPPAQRPARQTADTRGLSRAAALALVTALAGCDAPLAAAYGGPPPMADASAVQTDAAPAPAPTPTPTPPLKNTESPPAPAYGGPPPMATDAGPPSKR